MTRAGRPTLGPGSIRLYRLEELEADGSVQVATGHDPTDGSVVVFLRVGLILTALTIDGAAELAIGLAAESEHAARELAAARAAIS